MLAHYNFDLVLSAINKQHQEYHGTYKNAPNGIRYFAKLEQMFRCDMLDSTDKRKVLPYLSKN